MRLLPSFPSHKLPNFALKTSVTWGLPEIGVPSVIIHFRLGFSHSQKPSSYWGTLMTMETLKNHQFKHPLKNHHFPMKHHHLLMVSYTHCDGWGFPPWLFRAMWAMTAIPRLFVQRLAARLGLEIVVAWRCWGVVVAGGAKNLLVYYGKRISVCMYTCNYIHIIKYVYIYIYTHIRSE